MTRPRPALLKAGQEQRLIALFQEVGAASILRWLASCVLNSAAGRFRSTAHEEKLSNAIFALAVETAAAEI